MEIGCVLLASGLARRFGRNKLLEEVEGKQLIERVFDALPTELFSGIAVVTAYDEIDRMARGRGWHTIRNAHPERGMGSTIKLGIAAMENTDACMICVCDQPHMNIDTLRRMVASYEGGIAAVSFGAQRGNPVLFPRELYGELMAIEDSGSGRSVIEKHQEMLVLFPAENKKELKDIDYLHDIERSKKMKTQISTKNAPGAIGPYSQGISGNRMVYTSGQLPINPETGEMPDGIEEQTKQSLENLKGVIEAAGAAMSSVVKTTVFLQNMSDFAKMNDVYARFFSEPHPARSCVEVAKLPKDALVEIECVAMAD